MSKAEWVVLRPAEKSRNSERETIRLNDRFMDVVTDQLGIPLPVRAETEFTVNHDSEENGKSCIDPRATFIVDLHTDETLLMRPAMTLADENHAEDVSSLLDRIAVMEGAQSNCMFQLALMLARIAVEPCAEAYKEQTAQALLRLIRNKPKSNVVRLFGAMQAQDRCDLSKMANA